MYHWLKKRLVAWLEGIQQREIERLHRESLRLKAELLELNDGKPIRLTPEQCQLLVEKAKGLDPETLKRISVVDFENSEPPCPDDTSPDSE